MPKTYERGDRLRFGKYKDEFIEDVIIEEPEYIQWCVENLDNFLLSNDLYKALQKNMEYSP